MERETAKFQFLGYRVIESRFEQNTEGESSQKIQTSFEVEGRNAEDASKFILTVKTHVRDSEGVVSVDVEMAGLFSYDSAIPEEQRERFFTINGPAILFPYIRAYISTLTALGGITPITLPTINFAQLGERGCR